VIFVGEELTVFGFVKGEYQTNFENHWYKRKGSWLQTVVDSGIPGRRQRLRGVPLTEVGIQATWKITKMTFTFTSLYVHIAYSAI